MVAPPRISGTALRQLARFARTPVGALALRQVLLRDLRINEITRLPDEAFGDAQQDNRPLAGRPPRELPALDAREAAISAPWQGHSDSLAAAYRAGKISPRDVVTAALAGARSLAARTPSVGPLMAYLDAQALRDAEASAARYRQGAPRGPLDGVPFAVKEQTAMAGLALQAGSSFGDPSPQREDATVVARLREAGAILLGQTPMTEYGMTPLGYNPKRSMPRNPHATDRVAGGSSTGSGVAVATGVAPIALGVDGGGSIRIPAALNGVWGIKPTWGRVSRTGTVAGGTVAHVGPLASSVLDLARVLDVIAGRDPQDPQTDFAPETRPGEFERALARGVRGVRIGVDEREWREASEAVSVRGREALRALERAGAVLVEIRPRLMSYASPVGYLSIGQEDRAAHRGEIRDRLGEYNLDLQISYAVLATITAPEYFESQRLRTSIRREMAELFGDVDLVALPTTGTTAPRVSDGDMASGFLDARALDAMCRFNFLGNITGLPGLSAPVGRDEAGLPVGLQLLGDAYDEATVLAAGAALERTGAARVERPAVAVEYPRG